jgi:polo-like kinase 4
MDEIGFGKSSTVYLVNCKRGRLRNRQLALRKVRNSGRLHFVDSLCLQISADRSDTTELPASSSIHLSLSHPCIVSLFSTFSKPSAHFHLLELCPGGALSGYLEGKTLSEGHLRGVLKSLFEALLYLKNLGVVHRNIRPSNILLTTDGRIKLCDFKLATNLLPPSKHPANYFANAPHFVAPYVTWNSRSQCHSPIFSCQGDLGQFVVYLRR